MNDDVVIVIDPTKAQLKELVSLHAGRARQAEKEVARLRSLLVEVEPLLLFFSPGWDETRGRVRDAIGRTESRASREASE